MAKFEVEVEVVLKSEYTQTLTVEADSQEDALEKAEEEMKEKINGIPLSASSFDYYSLAANPLTT